MPWPNPQASALAKVQPVPCVSVVSIRLPLSSASRPAGESSRSTITPPAPCPPLAARWQPWASTAASPPSAASSGMFGVTTEASVINRPKAAMVSGSARVDPLVAIITGSNTIGTSIAVSQSATACAVSAEPIIPIFTASTPISSTHDLICAITISVGTGCTACTPSVFCAVIAVIAVIAWPPSIVTVLISA